MVFIFFIIFTLQLGFVNLHAETNTSTTKETELSILDDSTAPQVYVSETQIAFERLIISLINKQNLAYLIFDLEVNRIASEKKDIEAQNKEIPNILDFIITDLTTALELFWNGLPNEGLQASINKRLTQKLKHKYPWVDNCLVLNFKIQE